MFILWSLIQKLYLLHHVFFYSLVQISIFLLVSVFVNFPIFPISYTAFNTIHMYLASCTLCVSNFIYMAAFHVMFRHFSVVQVYFISTLFRTHLYVIKMCFLEVPGLFFEAASGKVVHEMLRKLPLSQPSEIEATIFSFLKHFVK